jgi:hypothetical protein
MWIYHTLVQLIPAFYIPTITGFFNTATCHNAYIQAEFEILPDTCFASFNVILILISTILVIAFILASLFMTFTCFEWRMDLGNVSAKPHARYDLFSYVVITFLVIVTCLFEFLPVIPLYVITFFY